MKVWLVALGLASALALNARADDVKKEDAKPKRAPLTEEQKKLRQEMVEKYDANKNGRLDPEERKSMSQEDKDRLAKAGLGGRAKKPETK